VGVFVTAVLVLAGEKSASAQALNFGDRMQLVINAENLTGFSTERRGRDTAANTETSTTTNQFVLLYRNAAGGLPRGPWVGAHLFVIPNLSVGLTLGFQSAGGSVTTQQNGTTVTTDQGTYSSFILLPKVGYYLALNNMLGFWFRGGPGFARSGTSDPNDPSGDAWSFWFLSLDALFVVTPASYISFYVGPQGNLSFSGSYSNTNNNGATTSWDASYRSFSIDAGIGGYFDL
jgi:hypothetical protein